MSECQTDRRTDLERVVDELRIEVVLDPADGEDVEHPLATTTHDVDELVAVSQHHVATADDQVG